MNPIIATLLITVIVVVLTVTAWSFYSGFLEIQRKRASETIGIDAVKFGDPTVVYVRNTGTVKSSISAVYVEGEQTYYSAEGLPLEPGDVKAVQLTAFTWSNSETYTFKVVSTTGASVESEFTAPAVS